MGSFALAGAIGGFGEGLAKSGEMAHENQKMEREAEIQAARDRRLQQLRMEADERQADYKFKYDEQLEGIRHDNTMTHQTAEDEAAMERTKEQQRSQTERTNIQSETQIEVAKINQRNQNWRAKYGSRSSRTRFKGMKHKVFDDQGYVIAETPGVFDQYTGMNWDQYGSLKVPSGHDFTTVQGARDKLDGIRKTQLAEEYLFENFESTPELLPAFIKRFGYTPFAIAAEKGAEMEFPDFTEIESSSEPANPGM